jgi:asparagine synthase (glutamine-hydrolysing)
MEQKSSLSGVGYSWIDTLEVVAKEVSDEQLANAKYKFPLQTPTSKEEYYYRSIFY